VPFPPFPILPDDDPLVALTNLRSYIRQLVNVVPIVLVLAGTIVFLVSAFALASVFLGFDTALSWAVDLVPFTFAVISVIVSVKTLRDEHHNVVIAFVLLLGLAGTVVIHYAKARADTQHQRQLDTLGSKVDSVDKRNSQLLDIVLKKPELTEAERREGIRKALLNKYILTHDNISPGLLSGIESPPAEWMNKRLQELGEKWKVAEKPAPPSTSSSPSLPPKLARMQFSFWSYAPNAGDVVPIKEITVPLHGNSVTLDFTVGNVGEATALNTDIWVRLCTACSYANEPDGFQRAKGMAESDRTRLIQRLSVGTYMEKMTVEVVPPPVGDFNVDFISSCDTCELDNGKPHKERFLVHVSRP
jgi:hypothetical protein